MSEEQAKDIIEAVLHLMIAKRIITEDQYGRLSIDTMDDLAACVRTTFREVNDE